MQPPIAQFSGPFRFLSNFFPAKVDLDGLTYPTVEHAYQAAKTLDHEKRMEICVAKTPGQAKRLGRHIPLRDGWESLKLGVMEDLLRQKFSDPDLAGFLLATDDRMLIEGNTWGDRFWGVCGTWGENHLGRLLMQVRKDLHGTRRVAPP